MIIFLVLSDKNRILSDNTVVLVLSVDISRWVHEMLSRKRESRNSDNQKVNINHFMQNISQCIFATIMPGSKEFSTSGFYQQHKKKTFAVEHFKFEADSAV